MKDLLQTKDFEVITTLDRSKILYYTPNTQIYSLSDRNIKEYISICRNKKKIDSSFLSFYEITKINSSLNKVFKNSLPSTILKKAPKTKMSSLILPVSGNCNLRCSYCFASVNGKFDFNDITPIESGRIIDFIFVKLKLDTIFITFFGGEPLLNLETIEFIIKYISENYPDRQVRYSITTNGTLLNEKIIKTIKENGISVLISIDGPNELNKYRADSTGKNSFEKVMKTICQLKEEGVVIHLRSTITNDILRLVDVFSFFEELEIPFKIIFAHGSENNNYELANYNKSLKSIEKQLKSLILYYVKRIGENKRIYCDSITEKLKFLLYRTKNYHACTGGRSMFSITAEGEIYSCEHLAGLRKYSVGDIWNGINKTKLNSLRTSNIEKLEDCSQCWLRYFCAGGCFSNNLSSTSNIRQPDKRRCDLIKVEHKFIIVLYYEIKKRFPEFFEIKKKSD